MKRPSFQFYPAEWRKDVALQSCSIAARGLWVELCCLMHDCEPYGHLTLNGAAMPDAKAAALIPGVTPASYRRMLAELEAAGVPSRLSDGTLFSRRMVRDEGVRNARANGGQAGAEFGARGSEHGRKGGRPRVKGGITKPPFEFAEGGAEKPPPSSSSSSSSANLGVASQPVGLAPDGPNGHGNGKVNGAEAQGPDVERVALLGRDVAAAIDGLDAKARRGAELARSARAVLAFLNEKAGKRFPETDSNVGIIVARFREGFTPEQVRQVIAMKVRKWKGDEKMAEYMRPATLFGRTNFSNYVGELVDIPDDAGAAP